MARPETMVRTGGSARRLLLPSVALLLTVTPFSRSDLDEVLKRIAIIDAHGKTFSFLLRRRYLASPDAYVEAFCSNHAFEPIEQCIGPLVQAVKATQTHEMAKGGAVQFTEQSHAQSEEVRADRQI